MSLPFSSREATSLGAASAPSPRPGRKPVRACFARPVVVAGGLCLLFSLTAPVRMSWADDSQQDQDSDASLKQLSLEQLGDIEVTTVSKDPQQVLQTPAAVFVITQEDIRRSGATSIP